MEYIACENVYSKIRLANNKYHLFDNVKSVLVGFSGGKDSTVLLHALKSMSGEFGIEVYAMHVNHQIRGNEALRDETFCKDFCEEYGIPFLSKRIDVPTEAEKLSVGLEEAARIMRYDSFERVLEINSIDAVATAHTMSDNEETLIFRAARGSSAKGMCGIPPKRDNIIRPLILCSTQDVLAYADELCLSYVCDSTNNDLHITRNMIRKKICPLLEKINPKHEEAFSSLADSLRNDCDYIESMAEEYYSCDSCKVLALLHPAILSRVINKKYSLIGTDAQLTSDHIYEISKLLKKYSGQNVKKLLCLPGDINIIIDSDNVKFEKQQQKPKVTGFCGELRPGLNDFSKHGFMLYITNGPADEDVLRYYESTYGAVIHTEVKASLFSDKIIARSRNDGDTYVFGGMTRKVKKLFNENGVERDERDDVPLICDSKGILWIPSFPVRDGEKPNENENKIKIIYIKNGEMTK